MRSLADLADKHLNLFDPNSTLSQIPFFGKMLQTSNQTIWALNPLNKRSIPRQVVNTVANAVLNKPTIASAMMIAFLPLVAGDNDVATEAPNNLLGFRFANLILVGCFQANDGVSNSSVAVVRTDTRETVIRVAAAIPEPVFNLRGFIETGCVIPAKITEACLSLLNSTALSLGYCKAGGCVSSPHLAVSEGDDLVFIKTLNRFLSSCLSERGFSSDSGNTCNYSSCDDLFARENPAVGIVAGILGGLASTTFLLVCYTAYNRYCDNNLRRRSSAVQLPARLLGAPPGVELGDVVGSEAAQADDQDYKDIENGGLLPSDGSAVGLLHSSSSSSSS